MAKLTRSRDGSACGRLSGHFTSKALADSDLGIILMTAPEVRVDIRVTDDTPKDKIPLRYTLSLSLSEWDNLKQTVDETFKKFPTEYQNLSKGA